MAFEGLAAARAALSKANERLNLVRAGPRSEEIERARAAAAQAEAALAREGERNRHHGVGHGLADKSSEFILRKTVPFAIIAFVDVAMFAGVSRSSSCAWGSSR